MMGEGPEGCREGPWPCFISAKSVPERWPGGSMLSERFWGHSSLRPGQGAPPGRQGSEAVLVGRLVAWQPQAIPQAMIMFARDSSR